MSSDPPPESGDGNDSTDAETESTATEKDEVQSQVEPQVEPELDATDEDAGAGDNPGEKTREKGPDEQFCGSCGQVIKRQAEFCPHCGVRAGSQSTTGTTAGTAARTGQQTADPAEGDHPETTAPDEMFCPSCGEAIKKAAEVCPHCGVRNTASAGDSASAGSSEQFCGTCGKPVKSDAEVCPHCGVRQAGTATAQQRADEESTEQFCSSCGERIRKDAELCPHCGVRNAGDATEAGSDERDEAVAAVLSFFIPGGGQLYNDQTERGLAILAGYIAFWVVTILGMFVVVGFLLVFLAPLFHVGAAWDAFVQAQKRNEGGED